MEDTITVKWKDLGSPTTPGIYRIKDVGDVEVTQSDIDEAAEVGEDTSVTLHESTTLGNKVKTWAVGIFTP